MKKSQIKEIKRFACEMLLQHLRTDDHVIDSADVEPMTDSQSWLLADGICVHFTTIHSYISMGNNKSLLKQVVFNVMHCVCRLITNSRSTPDWLCFSFSTESGCWVETTVGRILRRVLLTNFDWNLYSRKYIRWENLSSDNGRQTWNRTSGGTSP